MEALADELLLQIFKYLSPLDLLAVSKVHIRFKSVVKDKSLWIWIDSRSREVTTDVISHITDRIHEGTTVCMLSGSLEQLSKFEEEEEQSRLFIITKDILSMWCGFNGLTILALEQQFINGDYIKLIHYPPSLRELSFNKSIIKNYYKFFHFCSKKLRKLKVLTMEFCQNIEEHVLLSLSNLPELEILSLYGCMDMKDAIVPIKMSFELGFRKLRVLDVRCTGFGDELLRFASKMEHLGELYFHCYFNYTQERTASEDDVVKLFKMSKISRYRDIGSATVQHGTKHVQDYLQKFTDIGLLHYRKSYYNMEAYIPPYSHLYERPFGKCTCAWGSNSPNVTSSLAYDVKMQHLPSTSSNKRSHCNDIDDDEAEERPKKRRRLDCVGEHRDKIFKVEYQFENGTSLKYCDNSDKRGVCLIELSVNTAGRGIVQSEQNLLRQEDRVLNNVPHRARVYGRADLQIEVVDPLAYEHKFPVALNALMLRGSAYGVKEFGLSSLQQLHLDILDLTGTGISRDSLKQIQTSMPNCRIIHESMCTCQPR